MTTKKVVPAVAGWPVPVTVKARSEKEARAQLKRPMCISLITDAGDGAMYFTFRGVLS